MPLVSELKQILAETAEINRRAEAIITPLSPDQLLWRPGEKKWSLAEIFAHLEITTDHIVPSADRAIAEARKKKLFSGGPFHLTPMGRFFLWYVEPPPKIKLPAPKSLHPIVKVSAAEILPSFLRSQEVMLQRVHEADGLDLNRARFVSPFASFVKMDLLAVFRVFTSHERRHLFQAENVLRQMPSAIGVAGSK